MGKKGKDILILGLGKESTQGSDDTALTAEATAEAKYPINFTQSGKSLRYNGSSSFLFVDATKYINSK